MTFLFIALLSSHFTLDDSVRNDREAHGIHKTIPAAIETQALYALSYYPELNETDIRFVFTTKLSRTAMAARPVVGSMLKKRDKRAYEVLINPTFHLENHRKPIQHIPDSVMIGWLGHELGHILDYKDRSSWNLAGFGISYWISKNFIRKAEHTADSLAVARGMGEYIATTKSFILDHSDLPQSYKDRIANLYLSPHEIMELIAELEEEDELKKATTLSEEEEEAKEKPESVKFLSEK